MSSCYHLATIIEPLQDVIEFESDILPATDNRKAGPPGNPGVAVDPAFLNLKELS